MKNSHILAHNVVREILNDLNDRSGLQNVWDEIDPYTQKVIRDKWEKIIVKEINSLDKEGVI